MVKCSPDEDSQEGETLQQCTYLQLHAEHFVPDISGICNAVASAGIDGIIIGNTTRKRPDVPHSRLRTDQENAILMEEGGYSGAIMFDRTLSLVKKYKAAIDQSQRKHGAGKDLVIFATGGISNGKQALEILQAGADVAMVYADISLLVRESC